MTRFLFACAPGPRMSSFPPLPMSPPPPQQHPLHSPQGQGQGPTTIKLEPPDYYAYSTVGFSGGGLSNLNNNNLPSSTSNSPAAHQSQGQGHQGPGPGHYFQQPLPPPGSSTIGMTQQQIQSQHQQQQLQQQQQQQGQGPGQMDTLDDLGNISLPNLSDVNLSLLENHLSENFSSNLVLDADVQVMDNSLGSYFRLLQLIDLFIDLCDLMETLTSFYIFPRPLG